MISEMAYLFLCAVAIVFLLSGLFKKAAFLTLFSVGLFAIAAIFSGNVGNPDGTALYADYVLFGPIMGGMCALSAIAGIVQLVEK